MTGLFAAAAQTFQLGKGIPHFHTGCGKLAISNGASDSKAFFDIFC